MVLSYDYRPIEASIMGADGSPELGEGSVVGLQLLGSLVRQRDIATGDHLVMSPPDRLRAAVVGRPRGFGHVHWLGVSAELVATDLHRDPAADFAPPPDAYSLLGAQLVLE